MNIVNSKPNKSLTLVITDSNNTKYRTTYSKSTSKFDKSKYINIESITVSAVKVNN